METNTIIVKCPMCGGLSEVPKMSGIESKNVKCAVCHYRNKFTDYKIVNKKADDPETDYGNHSASSFNDKASEGVTRIRESINNSIGLLRVMETNQTYQCKSGRNIVGRKATSSQADFQISLLSEQRRLSREHIVVEVKKKPGKGYVHILSLVKELVNVTYINETVLEYGDKIVLKNRDVIRLPHVTLLFTIPDDDETEICN